ncbi:hypothetical protein [Halorussus halophilus]|uniref:hypothetical protein n=1 Tax=Halorussus halophilus TaxID=2650975 RepID=UPI001CE3F273|nr:hypothetical protein [Halorussus halophilus]
MNFNRSVVSLDLVVLLGSALIGVVVGLLSLLLHIGQYGIAFAFLTGSGLYTGVRYSDRASSLPGAVEWTTLRREGWLFYLSQTLYVLFLVGAVVSTLSEPYERPTIHFVFVTLAFGTVLFDVLSVDTGRARMVALVLCKIVVASLAFRFARFFVMATMPGFDTHAHLELATYLAQHGAFPPDGGKYVYAPVWHFVVAGTQLLGFEGPSSVFAGIVVPYAILTAVGCYLLGTELMDRRAGLLAALVVSISDQFLLRGVTNITPSSVVIVLSIFIFVVLLRGDERPPYVVYPLVVVTFFTHQLSSFVILLLLWALWFGQVVYDRFLESGQADPASGFSLRLRDVLLLVPPMLIQWSITPSSDRQSFLTNMVERLVRNIVHFGGGGSSYAATLSQYGPISNFLYTGGYSILMALGIFGALLWLHPSRRTRARFAAVTGAFSLFTIIYPMTFAGLGHLLLPHRILVFFELFLVVFAVVALRFLYRRATDNRKLVGVNLVVVLLVFFMLTTPFINRNNPVYGEERVGRIGLTDAEVDAMVSAASRADPDQSVYLDSLIYKRTIRTELRQAGVPTREPNGANLTTYPSTTPIENDSYVVVREYYRRSSAASSGNLDINTFGLEGNSSVQLYNPLDCNEKQVVYRTEAATVYRVGNCSPGNSSVANQSARQF